MPSGMSGVLDRDGLSCEDDGEGKGTPPISTWMSRPPHGVKSYALHPLENVLTMKPRFGGSGLICLVMFNSRTQLRSYDKTSVSSKYICSIPRAAHFLLYILMIATGIRTTLNTNNQLACDRQYKDLVWFLSMFPPKPVSRAERGRSPEFRSI